jgi:hypothetical protein
MNYRFDKLFQKDQNTSYKDDRLENDLFPSMWKFSVQKILTAYEVWQVKHSQCQVSYCSTSVPIIYILA